MNKKYPHTVTRVLPVIGPEHYPKFRRLISSLPDHFAGWKAAHVETIRETMRSHQRLVEVVVYPDAFAMFLQEHGLNGSPKTLEAFATEMTTYEAASIAPALVAPSLQARRTRSPIRIHSIRG